MKARVRVVCADRAGGCEFGIGDRRREASPQ